MKAILFAQVLVSFLFIEPAFAIDLSLHDTQDMPLIYDTQTKSIFVVNPKSSASRDDGSRAELKEMQRAGSVVDLSGSFNPFPNGTADARFFSIGQWNNEIIATANEKTAVRSQTGRWIFKPGIREEMKGLCNTLQPDCKTAVFLSSDSFYSGSPDFLLGFFDPQNPFDTFKLFTFNSNMQNYFPIPDWAMKAVQEKFADFSIKLKIDFASGVMLRAANQKVTVFKEGIQQGEFSYTPTRRFELSDFAYTNDRVVILEIDNAVVLCPGPTDPISGFDRCNQNKAFQVRTLTNNSLNQNSIFSGRNTKPLAKAAQTVESLVFQGEYSGKEAPVLETNGTLWVSRNNEIHFYDTFAATDTLHRSCPEQLKWVGMMPAIRARAQGPDFNLASTAAPWVVCDRDLLSLNVFGASQVEIEQQVPQNLEAGFAFAAAEPVALLQDKSGIARFDGNLKVTEYQRDIKAASARLDEVWIEQGRLCGLNSDPDSTPGTNIACKVGPTLLAPEKLGLRPPFAYVSSSFTIADRTYVLSKSSKEYKPQRFQVWELKNEKDWLFLGESSDQAQGATLFEDGNADVAVRILEPEHLAVYRLKDSGFAKFFEAHLSEENAKNYNLFSPLFDTTGNLYQGCLEPENRGSLCMFDSKGTSTLVWKDANNTYFDTAISGNFGTLLGVYETGKYGLYLIRGKQLIRLQDFLGELTPYGALRPQFTRTATGLLAVTFEENASNGTRLTSFVFNKDGIMQTFSKEFDFAEARPSFSSTPASRIVWQKNFGKLWVKRTEAEDFQSFMTLEQALWAVEKGASADLEIRGVSLSEASGRPAFFATNLGLISCPENQNFMLDAARTSTFYAPGCQALLGLKDIDRLAVLQLNPREQQIFLSRDGSIHLVTLRRAGNLAHQRQINSSEEAQELTVQKISSAASGFLSEDSIGSTGQFGRTVSWIEGSLLRLRSANLAKDVTLPVPAEEIVAKSRLSLCTKGGVYELDEQSLEQWILVDSSPCLVIATALGQDGKAQSAFLSSAGELYSCQSSNNQMGCRLLNFGNNQTGNAISQLAFSPNQAEQDTLLIFSGKEVAALRITQNPGDSILTPVTPQYAYGSLLSQPVLGWQGGWALTKSAAVYVSEWLSPQAQIFVARFFAE